MIDLKNIEVNANRNREASAKNNQNLSRQSVFNVNRRDTMRTKIPGWDDAHIHKKHKSIYYSSTNGQANAPEVTRFQVGSSVQRSVEIA